MSSLNCIFCGMEIHGKYHSEIFIGEIFKCVDCNEVYYSMNEVSGIWFTKDSLKNVNLNLKIWNEELRKIEKTILNFDSMKKDLLKKRQVLMDEMKCLVSGKRISQGESLTFILNNAICKLEAYK